MAKKDVVFAMATEGGRIKSTFWQYGSRPIKVNRKRKRAIERAKHLIRMATIEVGDTVEVLQNTTHGYDVGTVGKAVRVRLDDVISVVADDETSEVLKEIFGFSHYRNELKLIKKGTK